MKFNLSIRFMLAAMALFVLSQYDAMFGMVVAGSILAGPSLKFTRNRLAVGAQEESPELKAINEVAKRVDEYKNQLGSKLDKSEFEKVSKQIDELKKGYDKMQEEKISESVKAINESVAKFAKQLEELREDISPNGNGGSVNQSKSFGAAVVDAIKAGNIFEKKSWGKGEHRSVDLKFDFAGVINKVAGTMLTTNVTAVGTNAIPFSLADYETGLTRIVRRRPWILTIANVSRTDKKYVQWAEQANPDGTATYTSEGAAKNLIDFDWVEKSAEVLKITAYIKVSKEALDDLDGLRSEIDMELTEQILLKVDQELYSGAGTTGILKGVLSGDTNYSGSAFAGTVVGPTKSDVIRVAIAEVIANNFVPDYAIVHPNDLASMDLEKASDGHYSLPPFRSADGTVINGVKIIASTVQTIDKFTVGDFTKFNVKMREDLTIDIGLDADDFTKNLRTILGEIRLVSYIKTNHAGAFITGDFSDAIAGLDSGS